jgi:hypothetical protein
LWFNEAAGANKPGSFVFVGSNIVFAGLAGNTDNCREVKKECG